MIAAWIKFNRNDGLGWVTPLVATVTLALGMLGMLKSITLWASHLFEPRSSAAAIALDAVARGVATHDTAGLPFDWHRLPCTSCSAPHYMPCGECDRAGDALQVRDAITLHFWHTDVVLCSVRVSVSRSRLDVRCFLNHASQWCACSRKTNSRMLRRDHQQSQQGVGSTTTTCE